MYYLFKRKNVSSNGQNNFFGDFFSAIQFMIIPISHDKVVTMLKDNRLQIY